MHFIRANIVCVVFELSTMTLARDDRDDDELDGGSVEIDIFPVVSLIIRWIHVPPDVLHFSLN